METISTISQLLLILFIIFSTIRYFLVHRFKKYQKDKVILLKIYSDKNNEIWPIAIEGFLSNIIWNNNKKTFIQWFLKMEQNKISLEFANIDQSIFLSIYCQTNNKEIIKNQLYAKYNNINIEEINDYTDNIGLFGQLGGKYIWADLFTTEPYIYPIKRYMQFEDRINQSRIDPIWSILSSISNLDFIDDKAIIQIVLNPILKNWRARWQDLMKSLSTWLFWHSDKLKRKYSLLFLNLWIYQIFAWPLMKMLNLFLWWYWRWIWAQSKAEQSAEDKVDKSNENPLVAASSKIARLWIYVNIRIICCSNNNWNNLEQKVGEIISSFYQFNQPHLNSFSWHLTKKQDRKFLRNFKNRNIVNSFILNTEELATIWHIPEQQVNIPNLELVKSKTIKWPLNLPILKSIDSNQICILWKTNFRNDKRIFWILETDRRRHIYIIWKTWMWKSTLLENMIYSDIINWKWVWIIDPHWDLTKNVLNIIPKNRINDVVLIDPSDKEFPVALNMLECKNPNQYNLVSSSLIWVFKKLYSHSWWPRLEHILRNAILALVENEWTTILWILKMLNDRNYRNSILRKVKNPTVISFWEDEFNKWDDRQKNEAISPIQNKIWQFLSSSVVRNILGQPKSTIDIRFSMDKWKIIIINLSKWKIWEDNSSLLWSMLITKFQLDAMSRAEIPEDKRRDFYLYVDEFQNFATDSFASILSEARKYKLNLTIANQYIWQMPEEVRLAVFWNVWSLITFQVWYEDAYCLENQFSQEVICSDIVSLPRYQTYMKLLINWMPSNTFSSNTLSPPGTSELNFSKTIIKSSRERYWRCKIKVENRINKWFSKKIETKKTTINMIALINRILHNKLIQSIQNII